MKWRPRLSSILMLVNVAVIALPLGSIFFFRIYENQLIQETERELISQAATIGAAYRAAILGSPRPIEPVEGETKLARKAGSVDIYTPIKPQLDLAKVDTLPSRPDGVKAAHIPSASAVSAGRLLTPILKRAQLTTLIGARVLDQAGTVVGGTAELGQNFAHVEEVAAAMTGDYTAVLRFREIESQPASVTGISRGTGVRVFVAFPVKEGAQVLGVVYLSRTPKSVLRHMYDERDKVALAALTVLFMAVSLAALTSRTISRPVGELLRRTRLVATGARTEMPVLEHPGTSEMSQLSEGISQMAKALSDRAEYIRTLANHVSHEFKTPLASIQGAAELLQDHHDTMTAAERQKFLENISGDGARLKMLLDRLLELARAENAERGDDHTALQPVAARVLADLPKTVETELDIADGLTARITEDALVIVLSNLVDNAVQHKARHVSITGEHVGDQITLRIVDDGDGISPSNRAKIFEHFFTTRRNAGGTGLGLGIVRALLAAHGGGIELGPDNTPGGASFEITLAA
jgi:signal transduction histidine kinase